MQHRVFIFALLLASLAAFLAPQAHGQEALAVIVNKNNPIGNVTLEELRDYCRQERKHWADNKRVTVVLRDPGQAERETVLQLIYRMSESDFNRYFLQGEFSGNVQMAPKHLSSAAGVRRFVFNVSGAIGFLRASEVDATAKVLRVNDYAPSDPQYPLRITTR